MEKHCLYGGAVETGQTGRTRDPVSGQNASYEMRESGRFRKRKRQRKNESWILKENHEKVCAAAEEAIVLLKNKGIFCRCSRAESWRLLEEYARTSVPGGGLPERGKSTEKKSAWECAEKNGTEQIIHRLRWDIAGTMPGSEAEQQKTPG